MMFLGTLEKSIQTKSIRALTQIETILRKKAADYARHLPDWPGLAEQMEKDADRVSARRLELIRGG